EAPAEWALALGISPAATELFAASDVIDLHVDSFIWTRIIGYDLGREHAAGPLPGYVLNQVDIPRLRRVGIGGATWVITTNPLLDGSERARAFEANLAQLRASLEAHPGVSVVRTLGEYRAARRAAR